SSTAYESVFHPYLLKEYRNRWFVIGRQEGKKKLINFALDRIKKIRNSSKKYQYNDLHDMSNYFDNLIGVTLPKNGAIDEIEIKVSSIQTPYIITKPIHNSQLIIKEYQDGSVIIRLSLIINEELKSVLLGYGNDIEVLKPASLRENMKTIFQSGFNSYS
ncbi:MAG: WYL domain-containing protein, partial [Chitinophagaceae bacterium]|nr:WYL domain-containing protein [Chitinophagaceae bacterium]